VRVEWITQAGSCSAPPPSLIDSAALVALSEPTKPPWSIGEALNCSDLPDGLSARVVGMRSFVDVLWLDASSSFELPSTSLSITGPDDTDELVLPGDYVRLVQEEHTLFVVLRVGKAEARIAPCERRGWHESDVRTEPLGSLVPDEAFAFRAGDVVLRQHAEDSDSDEDSRDARFTADLGEVISLQADGVHVRWLDGACTPVKPWQLHTVACA